MFCVALLLAISAGAVASYPWIESNIKVRNPYEDYSFINTLYRNAHVLYWKLTDLNSDEDEQPAEVLTKMSSGSYDESKDRDDAFYVDEEDYDAFNIMIQDEYEFIKNKSYEPSIYYIKNNVTGDWLTNAGSRKELEDNILNYDAYIEFEYDKQGDLNVLVSKGVEKQSIMSYRFFNWEDYDLKKLKDVTFIFAVSNENALYNYTTFYEFWDAGFWMVYLGAILLAALAALLLPFIRTWRLGSGFSSKIPLEIVIIVLCCIIPFASEMSNWAMVTIDGVMADQLILYNIRPDIAEILQNSINLFAWFVLLGITFLMTLSVRQIFTLGLKNYMRRNCLLVCFLCFIWKGIKKIFTIIVKTDFLEQGNKTIFRLLMINFIVVSLLSLFWFFAIPFLLVYSIAVFIYLRKRWDRIRQNYDSLVNVAHRMTEGNLDIVIEEDLAEFESLKLEMQEVQSGFRRAVEKETKSEKMKTELITNVSHDLKTPLTAIITYIDLLKDESITQEDRALYIETLEKKSLSLKRLIEDLFEVSKTASKNVSLQMIPVDIIALLKQVQLELCDKITESEIDFRCTYPVDKLILTLDSSKAYRIFENLFINITKYAVKNSRAYMDLTLEEGYVIITIRNMSADEINYQGNELSERFVRGDKSRNSDGSGLGLAIAKNLVELQNGTFDVVVDGDLFKVIVSFPLRNECENQFDSFPILIEKSEV